MIQRDNELPDDAIAIRREVFMMEQGFKEEFDVIDSQAVHLVYYEDDVPAAVCRYYPAELKGVFVLGRIAVRAAYRGKKLGKYLVETAEKEIRKDGGTKIILSSQVRTRSFYEKCGFLAVGDVYLDEHCPHIAMEKNLPAKRS